jgi:hypothetical protein
MNGLTVLGLTPLPQLEADFRKIGYIGHGKFFLVSAEFEKNSEKGL